MELEEINLDAIRNYALKWKEERDEAIKLLYSLQSTFEFSTGEIDMSTIEIINRFLEKIEKGE